MGGPVQHRNDDRKRYSGMNDARGLGEHALRCGHVTRGNVVVTAPGGDRRLDWYRCPVGCGLQRRAK